MKKITDMHDAEFEHYVQEGLKSLGYAFPETDEQMAVFEKRVSMQSLPEEFQSPDFVFNNERKTIVVSFQNPINEAAESNWAIAARDGKDLPNDILNKMKQDKANARSKRNGETE
jgi:hypothetical protein